MRESGQLFDIVASAVLPALQDPVAFSCELQILEANYSKRQETVFFPGKSAKCTFLARGVGKISCLNVNMCPLRKRQRS